jgi:hypothetical protein
MPIHAERRHRWVTMDQGYGAVASVAPGEDQAAVRRAGLKGSGSFAMLAATRPLVSGGRRPRCAALEAIIS